MSVPVRPLTGCLILLAAALGLGCGGEKVHEAIHSPLLVTPAGAKIVILSDIAEARPLPTFEGLERFIRNRDPEHFERDDGVVVYPFRNVLPFDYQEFVEHYQLDLFRNIDQLVFAAYPSGWVAVLVGQFDVDHLTQIARTERVVEAEFTRGPDEALYTVLREGTVPAERALVRRVIGAVTAILISDWGPLGEAVVRVAEPSGELFEAWPTEHIWIISNSQERFTEALDLYDGLGLDDLLDDPAFTRLYESRPHSALVWLGVPESELVPAPYTTVEVEIDIRASIIPSVILSLHTPEEVNAQYPEVDRLIQRLAQGLRAVPEAARDPFHAAPISAWIIRLGLENILARAAETFQARALASAKVIGIEIQFPLRDFKSLFVALADETVH
jgi:hypothetical protein